MADVLADFISRLQARLGPDVDVTDIEQQLRRDWGGRWVYVSQRGANARRDDLILIALRSGQSVKVVAARYGLSERQIWKIAKKRGVKKSEGD